MVLGPKLFSPAGPPEAPHEVSVSAGSPDLAVLAAAGPQPGASPSSTVVLTPSVLIPESTTTTEPPASTTSTTAPKAKAKPTTTTTEAPTSTSTAPPTTTTTTEPPSPPPERKTAPPASPDEGTQQGDVSWYDLPGTRTGVCAHRSIAKGTVVTVTNLNTGESITCTVNDRGPFTDDGKVLDLAKDDFVRLAPLEKGVFPARLDW